MEVYTPIPDEVVRPARRSLRVVGLVALVIALAVPAAVAWRYSPQPSFRNFGTVQTRFGPAAMVCGAEVAPRCGEATGLVFPKCTPAVRAYFDGVATNDARARVLVGESPPTGDSWFFRCGWAPTGRFNP